MTFLKRRMHFWALLYVLVFSSCVGTHKRDSLDFPDPASDIHFELLASKSGKPIQLERVFSAIEERLMQHFVIGGERDEAIDRQIPALIEAVGDEQFALILSRQKPRTWAAILEFVNLTEIEEDYPETKRILASAPKVDWPARRSY